MWRLHNLLNYVRGNIRGGGWRVREPPSQLVSDDREREHDRTRPDPTPREQGSDDRRSGAAARQRCLPAAQSTVAPLVRSVPPAQVADKTTSNTTGVLPHLPPAATLWYLSFGLQAASDGCLPAKDAESSFCDDVQVEEVSAANASASRGDGDRRRNTIASLQPAERSRLRRVLSRRNSYTGRPSTLSAHHADPLESFSSARIAFATDHDRLMARLQNSVGASVASKRPSSALECFRSAAVLGAPEGWFNAGVCFMEGIGTKKDVEKASVCFAEASRLGHAAASYNLALLRIASAGYVTSSARDDVTTLLQSAVQGGCSEAAAYLPLWKQWCDVTAGCEDTTRGSTSSASPSSPMSRTASLPVLSDSGYDSNFDSANGYADSGLSEWESCGDLAVSSAVTF